MSQDAQQGTTPAPIPQLTPAEIARMTRGMRWVHTHATSAHPERPRPRPAS